MDSNEKMHRLMQIKQSVIEAESTPSVIRNRKVIRRRVIKKQGFGSFLLNKIGLGDNYSTAKKTTWFGKDGKERQCKYGQNEDGSCINGETVLV